MATIKFDKVFLRYTEHPPDANRGFDLSSSIISYNITQDEKDSNFDIKRMMGLEWNPFSVDGTMVYTKSTRCYTESLLISLPTPDFSNHLF